MSPFRGTFVLQFDCTFFHIDKTDGPNGARQSVQQRCMLAPPNTIVMMKYNQVTW